LPWRCTWNFSSRQGYLQGDKGFPWCIIVFVALPNAQHIDTHTHTPQAADEGDSEDGSEKADIEIKPSDLVIMAARNEVSEQAFAFACACVSAYTCTCAFAFDCVCVRVCECVLMAMPLLDCNDARRDTHTHIHTHTNTQTHTNIHTAG
jgi:hypothetical protein